MKNENLDLLIPNRVRQQKCDICHINDILGVENVPKISENLDMKSPHGKNIQDWAQKGAKIGPKPSVSSEHVQKWPPKNCFLPLFSGVRNAPNPQPP